MSTYPLSNLGTQQSESFLGMGHQVCLPQVSIGGKYPKYFNPRMGISSPPSKFPQLHWVSLKNPGSAP